jgi:hypothetical protein
MGLLLALLLTWQPDPSDEAIRKGITHLKAKAENAGEQRDLVLWTLVRLEVPASDPVVAELLRELLAKPLESTRLVALEAVILNKLDPASYWLRIGWCAQFLLDNQAVDGQWDSGRTVEPPEVPQLPEPPAPKAGPRVFGGPPRRVPPRVMLQKRREGAEKGDAFNSLWAAIGLWACSQAGVVVPVEVSERALRAWRTGEFDAADQVSGLAIYLALTKRTPNTDPNFQKALDRLADPKRPTDPKSLLALERAMVHADCAKLAGREWWPEGRKLLLESQSPDGSWGDFEKTCAALQYLYTPRYSGIPEKPPR